MPASKEYLDRNLAVCASVGITAACETALDRLSTMEHPPKWIIAKFRAILEREERIREHLVAYRKLSSEDTSANRR